MLENVAGPLKGDKGSAWFQSSAPEEHKTQHVDVVLRLQNQDLDPSSEKENSSTLDLKRPSSFPRPGPKLYRKNEILPAIIGLTYAVVHFLMHLFFVDLIMGILFISLHMWNWWKHFRRSHWGFFNIWSIWIKQMKIIILTLSSLNIVWTDIYWGIINKSWSTLTGTFVINCLIIFFIQIDLMEMSIFYRASIPSVLLIVAFIQLYNNKFLCDDIALWTFEGHTLTALDIQNVAWGQIVIFALLGLWAIVTDVEHKKFYLIEKNEPRGPDYTTKCFNSQKQFSLLFTCLVFVFTFRLRADIVWQAISGLLFMFFGTLFLRGVKMKCSYFLEYRPALLILSAIVILFSNAYRWTLSKTQTRLLERILNITIYVYCVIVAILSDFHTRTTKLFRLLLILSMVIETAYGIYYYVFIAPDYVVITIDGHTLGINAVERGAFCQILFLLIAQLVTLITDPNHTKFFLLPRRCERDEIFKRLADIYERSLQEKLISDNTKLQEQ